MLCIISPYAAVYAHGAHRVGRHGARGKHLRHSCDLWAWWCCLRCYCWLGCQWRDGRRPLAPLQQRLLGRGKIRNSCPEPADTWPHICIYTTSVWAAQAKPRSSQLATVWPLAVVSHSWCTSSQEGRLITIVTRREKSSICEIQERSNQDHHRPGRDKAIVLKDHDETPSRTHPSGTRHLDYRTVLNRDISLYTRVGYSHSQHSPIVCAVFRCGRQHSGV